MQSYTTQPATAKSLLKFLAGPAINHDQVLIDLLVKADSIQNATLVIFDFSIQEGLHYGEGMARLSGYSTEVATGGGVDFVLKITNPADVPYLMLLQSGYVQEAKSPGFSLCSLRFHDYYWSVVNNKDGSKKPVVSTCVVLTYTEHNDFGVEVGFMVEDSNGCDSMVIQCKELLRQIKLRHNEIYRHPESQNGNALYPRHYISLTTELITQRERQVLGMLAQGHSTIGIAEVLQIAANTVESHRKKLLHKFDAKNTAQLIMKASKVFWLT